MGYREYGSAPAARGPVAAFAERLEPRRLMAASSPDVAALNFYNDDAPSVADAPREMQRSASRRELRQRPRRGRNPGQPPPDVFATVLPPTAAVLPGGV